MRSLSKPLYFQLVERTFDVPGLRGLTVQIFRQIVRALFWIPYHLIYHLFYLSWSRIVWPLSQKTTGVPLFHGILLDGCLSRRMPLVGDQGLPSVVSCPSSVAGVSISVFSTWDGCWSYSNVCLRRCQLGGLLLRRTNCETLRFVVWSILHGYEDWVFLTLCYLDTTKFNDLHPH